MVIDFLVRLCYYEFNSADERFVSPASPSELEGAFIYVIMPTEAL